MGMVRCSLIITPARAKADSGWIDEQQYSTPATRSRLYPNSLETRQVVLISTTRLFHPSRSGVVTPRLRWVVDTMRHPRANDQTRANHYGYRKEAALRRWRVRLIIRMAGIYPWCHF
jgi:hypothetical protein